MAAAPSSSASMVGHCNLTLCDTTESDDRLTALLNKIATFHNRYPQVKG